MKRGGPSTLKTRSEYALAMGLSREPRTLLGSTTVHETINGSPPVRGKGRQALGWVLEQTTDPPRRFATAVVLHHA